MNIDDPKNDLNDFSNSDSFDAPEDIKNKIFKLGAGKIDYIELLDINKLIEPYSKNKRYKIFIKFIFY